MNASKQFRYDEIVVSICSITYNHAHYIRQCLDGFLMQKTNFSFEVLIHDDASTDGTEEIIKEYEAKYPEIVKPLYEKENQWVKGIRGSKVFNYPRARGKYIALCEGDDYWTDPYKLQKQVDFLEANPEYGMISSDINLIDEKGNPLPDNNVVIKQRENYKAIINAFDLLKLNHVNTLTVCARTNLMQELSERIAKECLWYVYDYWYWLNISLKSKIYVSKEKTANYRIHSKGVSRQKGFFDGKSQMIKYDVLSTILRSKQTMSRDEKETFVRSSFSLILSKKLAIRYRLILFIKNLPYYKYFVMSYKKSLHE